MLNQCKGIGWTLIAGLSLSSCAVGPNFKTPDPPPVQTFTHDPLPLKTVNADLQNGYSQHFAFYHDIPAQWWMLFHSQDLNNLILKGFENNPTITAAQASLQQAKENLRALIGTTLFPAFDLAGFAQRQRFSSAAFGSSSNQATTFDLFNTQVNVTYTLDIFGAGRRAIEALCAQVDYQRFELEATYLTLASNIASTAITQASLHEQIHATQAQVQLEEELLVIVKQQFNIGAVSQAEVLSQQTQLAQTKATLPPLEKSLAINRHLLAVLIGEFPSNANLPHFYLNDLHLPKELPVSLPSRLVKQRPDVRASIALLHQASAQIGVATASLFPQFTINGNYGWEANTLEHLFNPQSNIWSIVGQFLQPVFHGGALLAKRRSAIAAYDQALAQYQQTTLQAFQNVADSLRSIEIDAKTLNAQVEAEKAAKATMILTQEQFNLGATTFLSLLNAQRQYQQAITNRVQAQAARYTDTVALFQSLGGGWWNQPC